MRGAAFCLLLVGCGGLTSLQPSADDQDAQDLASPATDAAAADARLAVLDAAPGVPDCGPDRGGPYLWITGPTVAGPDAGPDQVGLTCDPEHTPGACRWPLDGGYVHFLVNPDSGEFGNCTAGCVCIRYKS